MPQTKYQVNLAVDGKHVVSVQSDDRAAVTEGLVWAQDTYKKLQRLGQSNGGSNPMAPPAQAVVPQVVQPEEVEICAIHGVNMVWQPGRKGYFWSCHEKMADGISWCTYRPAKKTTV